MFKYIAPTILIGLSIAIFFGFTDPQYKSLQASRQVVGSYDQALNNSKTLAEERDKLIQKSNSIGADNLAKLEKLLPSSVDNIRLILEIEKIALPYGMSIKDVKYDVVNKDTANTPSSGFINGGSSNQPSNRDYGVLNLEFSTEGSYKNFISFTKNLESNLRILDISSVSFSSVSGALSSAEVYKYSFKIKTYWLKN